MAIRGRDAEIEYLKRLGKAGGNMRKGRGLAERGGGPYGLGQGPRDGDRPEQSRACRAALAGLGVPMSIRQVAAVIGTSPWSIRQTWIPKGLPHVRAGVRGRFIFFEREVERWLIKQQKGGTCF